MEFNPLEIQACGENNFTIKALGMLAFRPDLRRRFVEKLIGTTFPENSNPNIAILYFSRIGENFFREAIDRERSSGVEFEKILNHATGLPKDFQWRRNRDGSLTQPAKWQESHITEMLQKNDAISDDTLKRYLELLQDCINTEPDIVLQWDNELVLIEIKVLSTEGNNQINRQKALGTIISRLLNWSAPKLYYIGPDHGSRPSQNDCKFISWGEIADWFDDVPEIADYIRSFVFFYNNQWQKMAGLTSTTGVKTAFDIMADINLTDVPEIKIDQKGQIGSHDKNTSSVRGPWHFSHLSREYFQIIIIGCRRNGLWPIKWIWLGQTGVPFEEIHNGRQINPNWMIEDINGNRRTRSSGFGAAGQYSEGKMIKYSAEDVLNYYSIK